MQASAPSSGSSSTSSSALPDFLSKKSIPLFVGIFAAAVGGATLYLLATAPFAFAFDSLLGVTLSVAAILGLVVIVGGGGYAARRPWGQRLLLPGSIALFVAGVVAALLNEGIGLAFAGGVLTFLVGYPLVRPPKKSGAA